MSRVIKIRIATLCVGIMSALIVMTASGQARAAVAGERFTSVDTQLNVDADGQVSVRHEIKVIASGRNVKRGIYLQIPATIGPVSEMQVTRNGISENFTMDDEWGPTLRTGTPDVEIEPGEHTYVIRYWARKPFVERHIRGADVEVFEWRPLMDDSRLPWVTSRLQISWPEGMAPREIGSGTSRVWRWRGPAGLTADGDPYQGMVGLSWWRPDGTFPEKSVRRWYVNNTLRYGMPLGFVLIWLMFHIAWYWIGRDRRPVIIKNEPRPPEGVSPAAARYILDMGPGKTGITAALMDLAVKGIVAIKKEGYSIKLSLKGDHEDAPASPDAQALLSKMFADGREFDAKSNTSRIAKGLSAQNQILNGQFRGRTYKTNIGTWSLCMLLVPALALFGMWEVVKPDSTALGDTVAVAIAIGSVAAAFIVGLVYVGFFKAPTNDGRTMMDGIEGLKQFMTQENILAGSDALPSHFFSLLPYAVSLNVEREWMSRFGLALDEANDPDTKELLEWYRSFTRDKDGVDSFTFTGTVLPVLAGEKSGRR
jgi:hypothetical protein